MRISIISFHFSDYAARLASALAARHEVQLHLSRDNADRELSPALIAHLEQRLDLHLHGRVTRKNCWSRGREIARQIKRFRANVIHAQEAGDWALAVARLLCLRTPFIYTVHDPKPHSGNDLQVARHNRLPRRFLRRRANAIIVHGKSLMAPMEDAEPTACGKVHAIHHGLLGEALPLAETPGDGLVFFGRIEAYKGLGVLLDAMDLLARRGLRVPLHIAGRGPDLERHRQRLAALANVSLDESFVPAEAVPDLLRQAQAVVLPYLDATQSGVVANAFAAAVPVIASGVGALTDVLTDGDNALLVAAGDASQLADAIERLLGDPALAAHLARGAVQAASGPFSWDRIAVETETIYTQCSHGS